MALRSCLLLAAAAAVYASCPNQCSGHGRCGDFDRCICFRQQGLAAPYRYGFTGPDCSQRACPMGKAFDVLTTTAPSLGPIIFKKATGATSKDKLQATFIAAAQNQAFRDLKRSQKFVVRVSTVATGSPYGTFAWRFEEDEYFSAELSIGDYLTSATALELRSGNIKAGVYIWWDSVKGATNLGAADDFTNVASNYQLLAAGDVYEFTLDWNEGQTFDSSDANTAHQLLECSGRGKCDYDSGKCTCQSGYTGEACQRTVCPNQCSGHGACQTELRFATEGLDANKASYATAYDAEQQYGCKCDKGYRGVDCAQMECPSGDDPLGGDGGSQGRDCSGRGLCDYTSGVCKCFKGYYGERCESQTTLI